MYPFYRQDRRSIHSRSREASWFDTRPKKWAWLAVLSLGLCLAIVPSSSALAEPPFACTASIEGQSSYDFNAILFKCTCLTEVFTGRKACRWVEQTSASPKYEWSFDNKSEEVADYAVTEQANSVFGAFGEISHYSGGVLSNKQTGWLAIANRIDRWNGSSWVSCLDSGFKYNASPIAVYSLRWGPFATPPCGDGYYLDTTYGFAWNGSAWLGKATGTVTAYRYWSGCPSCLLIRPTAPGPAPTRSVAPPSPPTA
jgi:hypothetical protein